MAASAMYRSIIEASSRYWFLTYPFKIFMYLSTGYIHLKKIGPHNWISLTRLTIKWTMISNE